MLLILKLLSLPIQLFTNIKYFYYHYFVFKHFGDSFKNPINQKVIDIIMKQLATEYSGSYSDTEIRS